jgi:hypothetical protein
MPESHHLQGSGVPVTPFLHHLRALAPGKLLQEIPVAPRAALETVWQLAGIDDETQDPDPWPCFCGQVWGCSHTLDVRLKGMLARLSEKEALAFMRLAGIHEQQTPKKRSKLLRPFFARRPRRRSENPVLSWFFALAFEMAPERCEDFLYSLKFVAITFLDRKFRRPPIAGRSWYLPWEAMPALLGRFSEYAEPKARPAPTIVCPGPAKVSVLAGRRGEDEPNDSAEARANGRLGIGLWHRGDLRAEDLPGKVGRRGKHLRNGHTVAGRIGVEAAILSDYAAQAAEGAA